MTKQYGRDLPPDQSPEAIAARILGEQIHRQWVPRDATAGIPDINAQIEASHQTAAPFVNGMPVPITSFVLVCGEDCPEHGWRARYATGANLEPAEREPVRLELPELPPPDPAADELTLAAARRLGLVSSESTTEST
jgi:hypothetical protein